MPLAAREKLNRLRKMLWLDSIPENEQKNAQQIPKTLLCPVCGAQLVWIEKLPPGSKNHVP